MSVTRDAFLGGRLWLWQPLRGYRAGVDAVLLAASVAARAGDRVLDLGCGTGAVVLCLATRVPGLALTGVERQAGYAALARRSAAEAGVALGVIEADLAALPADLKSSSFNHVVMNPPYFLSEEITAPADPGRAAAHEEETPLSVWVDVAVRRLVPGGGLWIVQRADRLADVLAAFDGRVGSVAVRPVQPRLGRDATLVLVQARKGGRGAFRLLPPLVLHAGATHADGQGHTDRAEAVLRDAAPLGWND